MPEHDRQQGDMSELDLPGSDPYDVAVIGGGPAGSSVAALLARKGHRVVLLEKERFPRYHIGESLITGVLKVVDELDLRPRLEALGFVKKFGGSLVWGADASRWTFGFIEGGPYPYSYQVRRADYDALLLTRARELGVHAIEEATMKDVVTDGDVVTGVRYSLRGGATREVRARLVVDASGQSRVVGRHRADVEWNENLRNVAIWQYFQNVTPLDGAEEGNILIENLGDGWFWAIPLHDGTTSVGYVTAAATASDCGLAQPDLLRLKILESTAVRRMLADAHPASDIRSARDWSYSLSSLHGPGWALVGDAAAFVDPLFSTGVALASLAAEALSRAADVALRRPDLAAEAMRRYEASYRDFVADILSFVTFFYNGSRDRDAYYQRAQGIVDPEKALPARQDFVALISGLACAKPVFEMDLDALEAHGAPREPLAAERSA